MPRRVVLLVGPPGSGKSTLAAELAADEGLEHLEAEMFPGGGFADAARRLGSLEDARAVVVRCCPTLAEQRRWESMVEATETIVLDVDPDECVRRIRARGRSRWRGEVKAAREWRDRRAEQPAGAMTSRDW